MLTIVNAIASLFVCAAMSLFFVFIFGNDLSAINKLPKTEVLFVKFGLAACTAGSLLGLVSTHEPSISEVMFNIGLASLFTWAAIYHYNRFIKR